MTAHPLEVNDTIIDGHNRYAIAQAHRFPDSAIPTKEMKFDSKDQALSWILKHQLGRRNLTDFQKNEIALKYEDIIARQMKETQGTRTDLLKPSDQMIQKSTTTRKELAKIAGTSEGSVQNQRARQTGRQLTQTELVAMADAVREQTDKEARESYQANVGRPKKGEEKSTQNFGEIDRHKRESVAKAAESIGVSENTYRDMKLVAEKGSPF